MWFSSHGLDAKCYAIFELVLADTCDWTSFFMIALHWLYLMLHGFGSSMTDILLPNVIVVVLYNWPGRLFPDLEPGLPLTLYLHDRREMCSCVLCSCVECGCCSLVGAHLVGNCASKGWFIWSYNMATVVVCLLTHVWCPVAWDSTCSRRFFGCMGFTSYVAWYSWSSCSFIENSKTMFLSGSKDWFCFFSFRVARFNVCTCFAPIGLMCLHVPVNEDCLECLLLW